MKNKLDIKFIFFVTQTKMDVNIFEASKLGDVEGLKTLISEGVDVNVKNEDMYGITPLHEASSYGHLEVMKLLISEGADVNAKDKNGETPLHKTSIWDRLEVMKFLISQGADVNVKDKNGNTPLHKTSIWDDLVETAEILISEGADINEKNSRGVTPLDLSYTHKNLGNVKLLISEGANYKDFLESLDEDEREEIEKIILKIIDIKFKFITSGNS